MLIAAAAALSSCATPAPQARPTAAAARPVFDGGRFAHQACAGCHAVDRVGLSRNPDAPPFRELARRRSDSQLATAIAEISRNGHLEMPPVYVTPSEQRALVSYLRSLTAREA